MRQIMSLTILAFFAAVSMVQPALADPPVLLAESVPAAGGFSHAQARLTMTGQLVELGHDPHDAARMALKLTPDDLSVLLNNPRMMQQAGALSENALNFLIAALVIGGLIALAAAGDGNVVQNTLVM